MRVESLLQEGMSAVARGDRSAALECFARVLTDEPRHAMALINRGGLLASAGQLEEALECFRLVPEGHPLQAEALSNAGYVLRQLGRMPEALTCVELALAIKPGHAFALANRGLTLSAQGKWEDAVTSLRAAVAEAPHNLDALHGLALALVRLDRTAEAMEVADGALAINRRHVGALSIRAYLLMLEERHEEALTCLEAILQVDPVNVEALSNRGCSLLALGRIQESLGSLRAALQLDPHHVGALDNYAAALQRASRREEALSYLDHALEIDPHNASALHNRAAALAHLYRFEEALEMLDRAGASGQEPRSVRLRAQILLELGRYEDALTCIDALLAQDPKDAVAALYRAMSLEGLQKMDEVAEVLDSAPLTGGESAQIYHLRGVLLDRLCRREEALRSFERALALDPSSADTRYNRSLTLLALGRFEEGLREMEARWSMSRAQPPHLPSSAPLWLGDQPIQGKTILIDGEQGLGDTLQFVRYVPGIVRRGGRVLIRTYSVLHAVLATLLGNPAIVSDRQPPPLHDLRCPVMSLPLAFGTTLETIPAQVPYLSADPVRAAAWGRRLGPKGRARIGIVWAGRQQRPVNHRRDMALDLLRSLLELPAQFISLQKEVPDQDREALRLLKSLSNYGEQLTDFADTAALIDNLDLVIAVDTSVAHLAGAMGKPVWVMNRHAACWRWLEGRMDSPWYPTMRLFRQSSAGDWNGVVDEVRTAAQGWIRQLSMRQITAGCS